MASKLKIKVNGLVHNVTASLDTPLLYVLHNELPPARPALRLRSGAVRCVLGAAGRQGDPLVRHAGRCRERQGDHDARGPAGAVREVALDLGLGSRLAAPAAAGVDRRPGSPLRLLPERDDDPGRRPAGDHEAPDRGADPHRHERASVPLRHLPADPDRDPEGSRRDGEGRQVHDRDPRQGALTPDVPEGRRRADRRLQLARRARGQGAGGRQPVREQRPVRPELDRLVGHDPRRQHRHDQDRPRRARPGHLERPADDRRRGAQHGALADALGERRHERDAGHGRHVRLELDQDGRPAGARGRRLREAGAARHGRDAASASRSRA